MMYRGLSHHANKELRQQLDAGVYGTNQTFTIKLPLTLPYQVDRSYERVDGEFEYKGEFYKLVKQQLKNDTLYIVCLKDNHEKQLVGEMIDFIKLANDLPSTSKTVKLFGSIFKDYTSGNKLELTQLHFGWSTTFSFETKSFDALTRYASIIAPPPRKA